MVLIPRLTLVSHFSLCSSGLLVSLELLLLTSGCSLQKLQRQGLVALVYSACVAYFCKCTRRSGVSARLVPGNGRA